MNALHEFLGTLPVRRRLRPRRKPAYAAHTAFYYERQDGELQFVCVVPADVADGYEVAGEA